MDIIAFVEGITFLQNKENIGTFLTLKDTTIRDS